MKYGLLIASVALIVVALAGFVPRKKASPVPIAASFVRFLALGDSYTIGEAVPNDQTWPMQLRDRIQEKGIEVEWYKIIARTGWKTRDLESAIAASSLDDNYNLVGLLIGVNDFFQGKSLDEYRKRFQGLLDQAISFAGGNKKRVFVVSIPDYAYTPLFQEVMEPVSKGIDDFNNANRKITLAAGVRYFDITPISRQGLNDPELVAADGLHPSGKQYLAWVQMMEPGILEMLKE